MGDRKKDKIPEFRERFRKAVDEIGGVTEMSIKTKLSRPTISFWYNGDRIPDAASLIKLSNALDVSVDYLLGITEAPSKKPNKQAAEKYTYLSPNAIAHLRESLFDLKAIGGELDTAYWVFTSGYFRELLLAAETYRINTIKAGKQPHYITLDAEQMDGNYLMQQKAKVDMMKVILAMIEDIDKADNAEEAGTDGKH